MPDTAVISCDAKLAIKRVFEWPSLVRISQIKWWRHQNKVSKELHSHTYSSCRHSQDNFLYTTSSNRNNAFQDMSENKIFFPQM